MTPPYPLKAPPSDVPDATLAAEAQATVDKLVGLQEEEEAHNDDEDDQLEKGQDPQDDVVRCAVSEVLLELCEALESRNDFVIS